MKTVLFIAYFFPPSVDAGAKRALGLYRGLPQHGYRPLVLTVDGGNYAVPEDGPLPPADGVSRVPERRFPWSRRHARREPSQAAGGGQAAPPRERGALGRTARRFVREWLYVPDVYRGFHRPALEAGFRICREQDVDAILTSSSPFTLLRTGRALSRATGVPWVADLRDLWTDNQFGYPFGALRKRIDEGLERRWLAAAAAITTATDGQVEKLHAAGFDVPATCVLNGFLQSEDEVRAALDDPAGSAGDGFRITFTGALYEKPDHSAAPFFEALAALRDRDPSAFGRVSVDFFGRVNREFFGLVERFGLGDCVRFRGLIPPDRCFEEQRRSDALLVLVDRKQAETIPTKLVDYLGAMVPILLVGPTDGEAAGLVERTGSGVVFDPGDTDAIAEWIRDRTTNQRETSREDRIATAERVLEYGFDRMAGNMAAVLDSVTG